MERIVLRPLKAIRAKCLDCCCGSAHEVRLCTAETCTLHPYRMGKRPKGYTDIPEEADEENTAPTCTVDGNSEVVERS
jgi:hypothetical protein